MKSEKKTVWNTCNKEFNIDSVSIVIRLYFALQMISLCFLLLRFQMLKGHHSLLNL